MITPDCCRKSGQTHQKEISSSGIQGVQSKERFLQLITVKKFCLPYAILCCTMNLHCIIYALYCVHIVYYTAVFPNCTLFPPCFLGFLVLYCFLYLYIVVFPLYITMMFWLCLSVQGCVFFHFFDVETSF